MSCRPRYGCFLAGTPYWASLRVHRGLLLQGGMADSEPSMTCQTPKLQPSGARPFSENMQGPRKKFGKLGGALFLRRCNVQRPPCIPTSVETCPSPHLLCPVRFGTPEKFSPCEENKLHQNPKNCKRASPRLKDLGNSNDPTWPITTFLMLSRSLSLSRSLLLPSLRG